MAGPPSAHAPSGPPSESAAPSPPPRPRTARKWTRTQLAIAAAGAVAAGVITLLFALDARDAAAPAGPVLTVSLAHPGASADEIEHQLVEPVERALSRLGGLHELRSTSEPGHAVVRVTFEAPREVFAAAQDVRRALEEVQRQLPSGAPPPAVSSVDPGAPLLALSLSGPQAPLALSELADEVIRRRLERLPGVGEISLEGAAERRLALRPDPVRLAALGVTLGDIEAALRDGSAISVPAGRLSAGGSALRVDARLASVEAVSELVVASREGGAIRLRDVASLEDGAARAARGPLSITVRAQQGASRREVRERVRAAVAELRAELPPGSVLEEAPPPARPPAALTLRLLGPEREVLRRHADQLEAELRASGAALSIERTPPAGQPEPRVALDRARIARLHIQASDVLATLGAATRAAPIGWLSTGGREVPIELVLDGDLPSALALLHVRASGGTLVPLSSLVTVTTALGEHLLRVQREPALELSLHPAPGHSLSSVRGHLSELTRGLPAGYRAAIAPAL